MSEPRNPELHENEEPSNDFLDTAIGFGAMFGFMFLLAIIATVASLLMGDAVSSAG